MRHISLLSLFLGLFAIGATFFAGSAHAVPVLIDYDEIHPKTFEDFEAEQVGEFLNPGAFDTFWFTAGVAMISDLETICRSSGKCLSDNDLLANQAREFSNFHPGTKAFGVQLGWVNPDQFSTLIVTVVGSKSSRVFSGFSTTELTSELAFFDKHGLKSVSFEISDLPGPFLTNYSFDNVVTSVRPVPVPVPLPATGWLLTVCVVALYSWSLTASNVLPNSPRRESLSNGNL